MLYAQFIANGILAGAIYALVASGFSLIYATNRFSHFAHGSVVATGAYAFYSFYALLTFPFWLSALLAIVFAGFVGVLCHTLVYKPLSKRGASSGILLIASLGIMIFLENLIQFFYGPNVRAVRSTSVSQGIEFLGAVITPTQMWIVAISILLLIGLWFSVKKTKLGIMMRAVSDHPELAKLTGIHTERIKLLGFFIGSAIAGLAGILVALEQNVTPLMGTVLIIRGFTGAVIGGVSSLPGAVLGSYVLGLVENIGIIWLPSGYKDAIAFVLLLVFLLFRPQGILGIHKGMRE